MLLTAANLDSLRVDFVQRFDEAYAETPVWWPNIATEIPSSAKSNVYGWIAAQEKMREWVGPRKAQNLSEHEYTLVNRSYEYTIELDRDDIEDDNLGMFASMVVPGMARAARKHTDQLLKQVLQSNSGVGPTAFDGQPFFDDAHPTYDAAGSTYDNKFSLALNADNFQTVWAAMASYTGEDGEALAVMPNVLIVPPQLKKIAHEILKGDVIAQFASSGTDYAGAGATNVLKGWAEPLVIPELANDPTRWYLADTTKGIKPFVYQNRRADNFVSRDNPQDPKVFDQKKFTYGVDNRKNVGVTLPFLMATSKP